MGRGEASNKKVVSREDWEKRLGAVKIRKEDMNTIIMNFLVTEVIFYMQNIPCQNIISKLPMNRHHDI